MSSLDGLPDFGAPIDGGPTAIFAAYGSAAVALVLPDHLEVATLPDGRPDFRLSLNRPALAGDPPWGALRLRVEQRCPVEQALPAARARLPGAGVAPALPSGGFARLVAAGGGVGIPDDLMVPQPLDWTALDGVRFTLPRLSGTTAALLKGALLGQALLVWARLEIEVPGVAPRLPLRISFAPRALLAAVLPPPPAPRRIEWDALVAALARGPDVLPIVVEGGGAVLPEDERRLGEALADRIRGAFGHLVPSAAGDRPTIELAAEAALPDTVQWDLAEPTAAWRPWALQLDPLTTARAMAARSGLAGLVEEYTSPLLNVGTWEIFLAANLPARREGVGALGVTMRAPAHPPQRLQDVVSSFDFQPPADQGTVRLQLAPSEPLAYLYAPYAVVIVGSDIRRLDAPERPHQGPTLEVGPDDFPVAFVPVSATAELLGQARLDGRLAYSAPGGAAVSLPFTLSADRPSTSLPLPRDATAGTVQLTATPLDGTAPLALGPLPAAPVLVGPWSFPQYGPQRISVEASFPDGSGSVAVDLLAEGQPESAQAITTLRLSPEAPRREWSWFASSPFHAGYRFRPFVSSGPPAPWSAVQPPSQPLALVAPPAPQGPPAFDLDGIHLYVDRALPSTLRYVPAEPIPARGPDGHPLMALIQLGAAGSILQLSVRFDLEDALRDRLRVDLSTQHLELSAATFQPAPIAVDRVTVRLAADPGGTPAILATSAGSGFPPWDAIFSIRLAPDQAARAARALAGQAGVLSVTVHANLPPEVTATFLDHPAAVERSADVAAWVAGTPSG
jgi:hypothetical protein